MADTHAYDGSYTVDWETLSKKDLFKLKLAGKTPCFGYIPCSKRAKFIQFLCDNDYIKFQSTFRDIIEKLPKSTPDFNTALRRNVNGYINVYSVESDFFYHTLHGGKHPRGHTSAYRPAEYGLSEGTRIATDKSNKIISFGKSDP